MLPEEATETQDKDIVYMRRFDKMQRDYLKTLVSPEVITEHQRSPQGQHSEALQRLLIYFRGRPQVDKYAITCVEVNKAYRVVALSGHRRVPPRLVEDRIYPTPKDAFHGVFVNVIVRSNDAIATEILFAVMSFSGVPFGSSNALRKSGSHSFLGSGESGAKLP